MSFIPSTFDEHQINMTVLGGKVNESPDALNISVILLNSGASHLKLNVFENLLGCNFRSIISVENQGANYSTEDISKKFPAIKFLIPLEKTSDGELINLAMNEIDSDYVLILRDNLYIPSGVVLTNLADRLTGENIYCLVPRLLDKNKNGLYTLFTPGAEKSHFVIDSSSFVTDGKKTIYPKEYIALYNRKKFIQLGGFDYTIETPYWQNLDLAVRSWLWGEETKLTTLLQFTYIDEPPIEDRTINKDYLKYYLKNEVPKYKLQQGYIKKSSFPSFLFRSSCGYLEAKRQFKDAKNWVEKNKYHFKKDLQTFIKEWASPDSEK
ncbi:MAG: hypothetical protein J6X78_00345 [Treponema sp.]|nr:hypothetical protein [Treponema sp.]